MKRKLPQVGLPPNKALLYCHQLDILHSLIMEAENHSASAFLLSLWTSLLSPPFLGALLQKFQRWRTLSQFMSYNQNSKDAQSILQLECSGGQQRQSLKQLVCKSKIKETEKKKCLIQITTSLNHCQSIQSPATAPKT